MLKQLTIISLLIFMGNTLNAQNEELTPGALGIYFTPEMQMCKDSLRDYPVIQYYQFKGKNAKSSQQILSEWQQFYKKPTDFKESGFLTVRFILNCHGEPRVHRFYEMDVNYQRNAFSDDLKKQVWFFVQQLGGFPKGIVKHRGKEYEVNYYYYFIFKIHNGVFESVAP